MRSFLAYCAAEDATLQAVFQMAKSVKGPTPPKKRIEYLEDDELAAMLAANDGATTKSRRNRADAYHALRVRRSCVRADEHDPRRSRPLKPRPRHRHGQGQKDQGRADRRQMR